MAYTEANKIENQTEKMFLYPNGTIAYFRLVSLIITCEFDYQNIPTDKHTCLSNAYMQNEFSDTGVLTWREYFS